MIRIENIQGSGRDIELRKVVVKLGSSVVVGGGDEIDEKALRSLTDSIARLREHDVQVIVVTSGAIGMGRRQFPEFVTRTIPDRQALAAIGQVGLMHTYKTLFNKKGFKAAQILLSRQDMEDRRRYLNARYTLERLLELGVVPVINENDTVTVDELKFGDNDELSAVVATKMNADLLVILTVVDGLFTCEPKQAGGKPDGSTAQPELIPLVQSLSPDVLSMAGVGKSDLGTGGMASKLRAAQMANSAGIPVAIACGKTSQMIDQIVSGQFRGTFIAPGGRHALSSRERWLAFGRQAHGRRIFIDAGAREALIVRKKSLLPAGVREVHGEFERGDLVEVIGPGGERLAKGLVNYASFEIERIKGKKTSQIREILGQVDYKEIIHRDNLAVLV